MAGRKRFLTFLLLAAVSFFYTKTNAQNWDINFVKAVNPAGDKSIVWRGLSSSVYPISLTLPVGSFIIGKIQNNQKLQLKSYEQLGSVVLAGIAAGGLKIIIDRKRPYETRNDIYPLSREEGKSFPSAHTTLAFATATTLSLQYKKWYVVLPAYAWAAGCGFSRLYLGEHYTTDVIAGAAIGTGCAFASNWLTHKIFR